MSFSPQMFFRKSFFVVLISGSVLFFSACQKNVVSGLPSALVMRDGVQAETFVPSDFFMVVKLGTDDSGQQKNLAQLAKYFPQTSQNQFMEQVLQGFDTALAVYGMTYQADVRPFVGEHPQALVAFGGKSGMTSPDMVTVLSLQDTGKADAFFQKLTSKNEYQKTVYGGVDVYSHPNGQSFLSRISDALVITNTLPVMKTAIDHARDVKGTFLENKNYQKVLAKSPANVGFFYFDLKNLLQMMAKNPETQGMFDDAMLKKTPMLAALEGEYFVLSAEEKGLRLSVKVFGDEEILKKSDVNFATFSGQDSYLYKKLPFDQSIFFVEGYGLKKMLEYDFKLWDEVESTKMIHESLKSFFAAQGMDFDKDVMALLDKGAALGMKKTDGMVPAFGLFIETSSNPDAAKKLISKLDETFHRYVEQLKTQNPAFASAVTFEQKDVGGAPAGVVHFRSESLPKEAKLPLNVNAEVYYGTSKDQLSFTTLYADFDKAFGGKTLADDENFKATRDALGLSPKGFFYMSPSTLGSYLGFFTSLNPSADKSSLELLRSYLSPMKGFLMTAKKVSAGEAEMEGFLLIKN